MLSKILPWDFIQKYPLTIDPKQFGLYSFLVSDPYLERVILDQLPRIDFKFSLYSGNEFTKIFIEDHFLNLSFFNEKNHIIILNAELIPVDVIEFLLENKIANEDLFLLFFFTKSNKQLTTLSKSVVSSIYNIELEMPRFWEGAKLWQFAQRVRGLNFDSSVSHFALENLEHNLESFFWLLDTIKINFSEKKINLKDLHELIKKERWDFFELIDLFHREPKLFFIAILKKEMDFEWMRMLSAFMQAHLVKILFPKEIKAKGKLSKYDQSIIEMSEKLNRKNIQFYLIFFGELEIMAKSSDQFLIDRLRVESLKEKAPLGIISNA